MMRRGRVEVICGSMFSGKTEELIRRLRRAQFARQRVEIFKPTIDVRYSEEEVVSHEGNSILSTPVDSSASILLMGQESDVVGIDEAQFFDEHIVEVCNECPAGHRRRGDEGACHLRTLRCAGLCESPHRGWREAGDAGREAGIRAPVPRMLPQGNCCPGVKGGVGLEIKD